MRAAPNLGPEYVAAFDAIYPTLAAQYGVSLYPFFLEGVELLSTPIQAVYTRTIAAPDWGGRATGKLGGVNYTAIVAEDAGGGSIVVPGTYSGRFCDWRSRVAEGPTETVGKYCDRKTWMAARACMYCS